MPRLPDQPQPSPPPEESIPPRLAEDLSALFAGPRVPAQVDSAILNAARAHLAKAGRWNVFSRHRRLLRWAGAGAAAAAAVALFVGVLRHHRPGTSSPLAQGPASTSKPSETRPALAGDLDGNGRLDILDAYTVARALADPNRTAPLPAAWDVNGDGVVDQKDVEWLANAAVRVSGLAKQDGNRPADVFRLAEDVRALESAGQSPPTSHRVARLGAAPKGDFVKGAGQ